MITFCNLIQDNNFRSFVEKRLAFGIKNPTYSFSKTVPALYKYRSFSKYAVDDIIANQITATSIGEFNDLFDGTMHNYGIEEERIHSAEERWMKFEKLRIAIGLPDNFLDHNHFVDSFTKHFEIESRLNFRALDYIGTYVCCLSSKCDSTLMWAHYANSSTGICIEYDFSNEKLKPLYRKLIFPVAYSQKPVDLRDLLADENRQVYQYPLDAAVVCAALNKSIVWRYENEWRLILILQNSKDHSRRLSLVAPSLPKSIAFGYHFLKSFFYYNQKSKKEQDSVTEHLVDMRRLLEYMKSQQIPAFIMVPSIGDYALIKKHIELDTLIRFINYHFKDNNGQNMRYYYVIHDLLMDLLEK